MALAVGAIAIVPLDATGLLLGFGWLDITTMASVHGTLNALGFALPSLAALSLEARRTARPFAVAVGVGR